MDRLDLFIEKRLEIAKRYDDELGNLPLKLHEQSVDSKSSYHLYVVRIDVEGLNVELSKIYNALREEGVGVSKHYIPMFRHPYYKDMGFNPEDFPNTMSYYRESISLPIYPTFSSAEQAFVIDKLNKVLDRFS